MTKENNQNPWLRGFSPLNLIVLRTTCVKELHMTHQAFPKLYLLVIKVSIQLEESFPFRVHENYSDHKSPILVHVSLQLRCYINDTLLYSKKKKRFENVSRIFPRRVGQLWTASLQRNCPPSSTWMLGIRPIWGSQTLYLDPWLSP